MNSLDSLLRELCPDGVEHKTLGEIGTVFYRGSGITRDQVAESGTPCIRYGEIYTDYGAWFDRCHSFTDATKIKSPKFCAHGDILFAITGEKVDDILKCTAYIGEEDCLVGGDIVVMKHGQNPKFLGYVLATQNAIAQKKRGKVKSKVVHSSVPEIQKISISLPPLPVQEEIVRRLDVMQGVVEALENELALRRKQYEAVREKLFAGMKVAGGGVNPLENVVPQ